MTDQNTGPDQDQDDPKATRDRRGMSPVPPPDEERSFGHGGAAGSQPGMGKRLATTEDEDDGHLGRNDLVEEPDAGDHSRERGREKSQPKP